MKNKVLILILFSLSLSPAFSNINEPENGLFENEKQVGKTDVTLNASANLTNGITYFELSVLNESKEGFYALKREYTDGRFVSVQFSKINTNTDNSPVIYHFKDEKISQEDFTYVLLRIVPESREFEVIKRWDYCYDKNEICPMDDLAAK